jgi:hypothetical protein
MEANAATLYIARITSVVGTGYSGALPRRRFAERR